MDELTVKFGFAGYGRWMRILETIAAKMDETDRCHVEYSVTKWCALLRMKPPKFRQFAASLPPIVNRLDSNSPPISVQLDDKKCRIEVPNLLKKKDEYSSNVGRMSRHVSGETPAQIQIQIQKEEKNPPAPLVENWPKIYKQVQNGFVELHRDFPGIPALKTLNAARKRLIEIRWKEPGFDWPLTLKIVQSSPFLRGESQPRQGQDKPFAFNFDFVFARSSRWLEILEGKYGLPAPEPDVTAKAVRRNVPKGFHFDAKGELEPDPVELSPEERTRTAEKGERFMADLRARQRGRGRDDVFDTPAKRAAYIASITADSTGEKP